MRQSPEARSTTSQPASPRKTTTGFLLRRPLVLDALQMTPAVSASYRPDRFVLSPVLAASQRPGCKRDCPLFLPLQPRREPTTSREADCQIHRDSC